MTLLPLAFCMCIAGKPPLDASHIRGAKEILYQRAVELAQRIPANHRDLTIELDAAQVAEESGTDLAQAVRRRLRVKEKQAGSSSSTGMGPASPCH